jgi:predicted lipoprotein with Yx(FWY)xxD motif
MRTTRRALAALLPLTALSALSLTGCGTTAPVAGAAYNSVWTTASASAPASPSAPVKAGGAPMIPATSTLIVEKTKAGYVLATEAGKTVYWYAKDVKGSGKSACSGGCLQAWPAVEGKPSAATGVKLAGQLGSITRAPGIIQATYDGYPLYTYSGDMTPGQATGNGAGGQWSVFGGAKVAADPAAAAAASAKAVKAAGAMSGVSSGGGMSGGGMSSPSASASASGMGGY